MQTKQKEFWTWFNSIADQMPIRAVSLRKTFEYLDTLPDPITIVETGCARDIGNWSGDGQSTILFDRYIQGRKSDSHVYSVDINQDNVQACRSAVSSAVTVACSDSVAYLAELNRTLDKKISLLYLDSFDVDWLDIIPSSAHHLKELTAIRPCIDEDTLVMVDDAPIYTHAWSDAQGVLQIIGENRIGGKGKYVAEFALAIGATMLWNHYQTAWRDMA